MEMLFIAIVALVAFAAVLIPLLRRRPGPSDTEEFAGEHGDAGRGPDGGAAGDDAEATARQAQGGGVVPPMAAGPATPVAPAGGTAPADARMPAGEPPRDTAAADEIELEVQRYRAALRAGTLCGRCGQANPADSRFCFDCGAQLPLAEAREFD
jgi:hypothetical protein